MSRSGFALQVSHVSQDFTVLMSFVNFIDRTLKILQLLNLLVELNVVMILLYSIDGSRQLLQVSNMTFNLIEQILPLDFIDRRIETFQGVHLILDFVKVMVSICLVNRPFQVCQTCSFFDRSKVRMFSANIVNRTMQRNGICNWLLCLSVSMSSSTFIYRSMHGCQIWSVPGFLEGMSPVRFVNWTCHDGFALIFVCVVFSVVMSPLRNIVNGPNERSIFLLLFIFINKHLFKVHENNIIEMISVSHLVNGTIEFFQVWLDVVPFMILVLTNDVIVNGSLKMFKTLNVLFDFIEDMFDTFWIIDRCFECLQALHLFFNLVEVMLSLNLKNGTMQPQAQISLNRLVLIIVLMVDVVDRVGQCLQIFHMRQQISIVMLSLHIISRTLKGFQISNNIVNLIEMMFSFW